MTPEAGYTPTPLIKKLGLKAGAQACILNAPPHFLDLLGPLPGGVILHPALSGKLDYIQFFVKDREVLDQQALVLKQHLAFTGMLWLCWPKKTSSLSTDLTREPVREIGLKAGLVDVKVCAIDTDWSGLKFVYRRGDREAG